MEKPDKRYIGDGVYASFDGYQFWLTAEDGTGVMAAVALENSTMQGFDQYREYVKDFYAPSAENVGKATND